MTRKLKLFLILLQIIYATSSYAFAMGKSVEYELTQDEERLPLEDYLEKVQEEFGVFFNYDNKLVRNQSIKIQTDINLSKASWLEILRTYLIPLNLEVKQLDETFYVLKLAQEATEKMNPVDLVKKKSEIDMGTSLIPAIPVSIQGTVFDESGEGLPGATIRVKGTSFGTITDFMGKFSIQAPSSESILVVSFIGFIDQEFKVGNRESIEVTLKQDVVALDEIVVVGYGTQRKKDLSSSISVVNVDQLKANPQLSLNESLQGLTPGVTVTGGGGAPGRNPKINIRGIASINNVQPLYVVDGVPLASADNLNPNDIESIQVLKDAASAAIYGSRGANGVIVVTTKKGTEGKTTINFDMYTGLQQVAKKMDVMNAEEYAQYARNLYDASNTLIRELPDRVSDYELSPDSTSNTNWQDALFRRAKVQNYNISIGGGSENGSYMFSLGYLDQEGTIINTNFKRYTARINSELNKGNFRFGESIGFRYSEVRPEQRPGGKSLLESAQSSTPLMPIYNDQVLGGFQGPDKNEDGHDVGNAIANQSLVDQNNASYGVTASTYGSYEILDGLVYKLNFGLDYSYVNNIRNELPFNLAGAGSKLERSVRDQNRISTQLLVEHTLNYQKAIGKHSFGFLAGYTEQKNRGRNVETNYTGYLSDEGTSVAGSAQATVLGGSQSVFGLTSYLGRVTYNYADKYFLTSNFRADGSSKFDVNNRWGYFTSASGAWRISEEAFFSNVPVVSNLKLRASYGEVGNQSPVRPFQYEATLGNGANYDFGNDGIVDVGIVENRFPSVGIQWETNVMRGLAVDVGLWDDKIDFTAEVYIRETRDMLTQVPLPLSTGNAQDSPVVNNGEVENKGLELNLGYNTSFNQFNFRADLNVSTFRNKVTFIQNNSVFIRGTQRFDAASRTKVGEPIGSFYGYRVEGIYQTQNEIDEHLTGGDNSSIAPGDIKYKDVNDDGVVNEEDFVNLGNPWPELVYALNLSMDYKNFDLRVFFQGIEGNEVFNQNVRYIETYNTYANQSPKALNAWTSDNPNTDVPRIVPGLNYNTLQSDRLVEDGSYMRLKNVTLGYTLPEKLLEKVKGLNRFRVYIQGQNILTFTKYTGLDPEIGDRSTETLGDNLTVGFDEGTYPVPRLVLIGLQVGF